MPTLDEEELIILKEFQENGRVSYAEISRKTGIPNSTIYDKTQRLISEGVIKKFTVIFDEEKVGINITAIIGVETGAKLYLEVSKELCLLDNVIEVYGTTGEFDLMIKVKVADRGGLSKVLTKIRSIDGIDDIFVSSILEAFKDEHVLPI